MPTEGLTRVTFTVPFTRTSLTRDDSATGAGTFTGHASVFNSRTAIGNPKTWGWYEEIDKKAFDGALDRPDDVRFLRNHNPDQLLGRASAGTLRLWTDRKGLVAEADLPDTPLGQETRYLIERGDLDGMSFGFIPTKIEWSELDDGTELARILDIDPLLEVSVVTFPAYEETDAAARSRFDSLGGTSLRMQRRAEALERFRKLSPPPGAKSTRRSEA